MVTPTSQSISPTDSSSGTVAHLFSSASGFCTEVQFSPVTLQGAQSHDSTLISHTQAISEKQSLPPTYAFNSQYQTMASIGSSNADKEAPWQVDSLKDFNDFSENVSAKNGQIESSTGVMTSEDQANRTGWLEWADQYLSVEPLDPNWTELLGDDVTASEPNQQVCL